MDATHGHNALESTLVARVATGDTQAFEALYRLYDKRVYHYIQTFIRDASLAEEIVGEVMFALWRGACTFTPPLDDVPDLPSQQETPIEGIQREQLGIVTRQALSKLSAEHQEILRLVFYEELPYEEIALLLTIPENTVKTRVFYAKQQLKRHMDRMLSRESVV